MKTNKKLTVVGLTGGIGAGKTEVASLFEQWGAKVVDADIIAREVISPGSPTLAAIKRAFEGSDVITPQTGELDRVKMGKIIFENREKRERLEGILHPAIRSAWLKRLDDLKAQQPDLIVYVVPLLFETATPRPELDRIILVTAPVETRVQRIIARDNVTREQALQRIHAQLPEEEKANRSDYILANESSRQELSHHAKIVFDSLTAGQ